MGETVKETPKSNSEPIKAFKIPKVKKIEKPEATLSKTVEPDVSKDPETKSKPNRDDLATKEVTNIESEEPHHSHGETDSDSEPSLTIAEDPEESARRRSSASESDSEIKCDPKASEPQKKRESKDPRKRKVEEKE